MVHRPRTGAPTRKSSKRTHTGGGGSALLQRHVAKVTSIAIQRRDWEGTLKEGQGAHVRASREEGGGRGGEGVRKQTAAEAEGAPFL